MKRIFLSFTSSILFLLLLVFFTSEVWAACTTTTKNTCGVCPDPLQYCKEGIVGSVTCEFVDGKCGFIQGCTTTTKNTCGVCPDPKQYCKEGIVGSVSCEFVNGLCGFTSPPGPTIKPYDPECSSFGGSQGIKTALGCLPTEVNRLFRVASGAKILVWAIGLGSGVAFLLGLYGAFLIATASGDPEKVQAGKELITSVIMGLMVIISSIFLLRITTGTILGLF